MSIVSASAAQVPNLLAVRSVYPYHDVHDFASSLGPSSGTLREEEDIYGDVDQYDDDVDDDDFYASEGYSEFFSAYGDDDDVTNDKNDIDVANQRYVSSGSLGALESYRLNRYASNDDASSVFVSSDEFSDDATGIESTDSEHYEPFVQNEPYTSYAEDLTDPKGESSSSAVDNKKDSTASKAGDNAKVGLKSTDADNTDKSKDEEPKKKSGGMSKAGKIAIAVLVLLVIGVVAFMLVRCHRKRKARKTAQTFTYYEAPAGMSSA